MLNNGVPLKFVCEVTRPANLCMISISLNSTYPELSFFPLIATWDNLHSLLHGGESQKKLCSHSRSSKLVPIESPYATSY